MKILCIVDNFPPEVNALASRTYEHALEWINQGHEVTVITCCPNFPSGVPYRGYHNRLYQIENLGKIKVIRVWSYIAANAGFTKRIIDFLSFSITSFLAGLPEKCDLILTSSPQFFVNFTGLFLKVFKNKKWIMEVRDLWPESIHALGYLRKSFVYQFLSFLEITFYNFSDQVIVVTSSFKINLENRGIDSKKIKIAYNAANIDLYKPQKTNIDLLDQIGFRDRKPVVGYLGTLGDAQDILSLLDQLEKFKNFNFLIIGDGSQRVKIERKVHSSNYDNIVFLGPVNKSETPSYYSIFDIGLIPLKDVSTFEDVIPSKLFELSAMRLPVLYIGSGECSELIKKYQLGLSLKNSEISMLGESVAYLLANKSNFLINNDKFIKEFSRKKMSRIVISKC